MLTDGLKQLICRRPRHDRCKDTASDLAAYLFRVTCALKAKSMAGAAPGRESGKGWLRRLQRAEQGIFCCRGIDQR